MASSSSFENNQNTKNKTNETKRHSIKECILPRRASSCEQEPLLLAATFEALLFARRRGFPIDVTCHRSLRSHTKRSLLATAPGRCAPSKCEVILLPAHVVHILGLPCTRAARMENRSDLLSCSVRSGLESEAPPKRHVLMAGPWPLTP